MDERQMQSVQLDNGRSRGTQIELSQPLAKRLAGYALAAGGAGLGIMVGAQPVQARIVYTPANIHFNLKLDLDLNHDGITDFVLDQFLYCTCSTYDDYDLNAVGVPGNGVLATSSGRCKPGRFGSYFNCAVRLARSAKIGSSHRFSNNAKLVDGSYFNIYQGGQWAHNAFGFLGFKFQIDGQTHYGWAEVSIFYLGGRPVFRGVVKGYAYNTVPNQPILAGETGYAESIGGNAMQPATLGLLALGAPSLEIWRPRKHQLAAE